MKLTNAMKRALLQIAQNESTITRKVSTLEALVQRGLASPKPSRRLSVIINHYQMTLTPKGWAEVAKVSQKRFDVVASNPSTGNSENREFRIANMIKWGALIARAEWKATTA